MRQNFSISPARTVEIELRIAKCDPRVAQVLERLEVAEVAAHTHVLPDKDHQSAAQVPPEMVVVGVEQRRRREIDVGLYEPEAAGRERTRRP